MRRLFSSFAQIRSLVAYNKNLPSDFRDDIFILQGSKKEVSEDGGFGAGVARAVLAVAEKDGRVLYRRQDSGDRVPFDMTINFLEKHDILLNIGQIGDELVGKKVPVSSILAEMVDADRSNVEVVV